MFNDLVTLSGPLPRDHRRLSVNGSNHEVTAETINHMQEAATRGKRDFRVRQKVGQILHDNCSNKDFLCYAKALFHYCRDQIYYAFDPSGVELVEKPWKVLESGIADCDSIVPLLASMLENIGLTCRYVTIKADMETPENFSHVFLECQIPRHGWVAMDPTMPDRPFGWSPDKKFPRKNWPASKDAPESHGGDVMVQNNGTAGMFGLGALTPVSQHDTDAVPGVEATVGVRQGNQWSLRMEPAAITVVPDQLELDTMQKKAGPIGAVTPDFFIAEDAGAVMQEKAEAMQLENSPVMVAKPAEPKPSLALIGLGVFGLWWLLRGR